MNHKLLQTLLSVGAFSILAASACGQITMVKYEFSGGTSDKSATIVAAGITATNATLVGISEDTSRSDVLGLTSADATFGNDDYVFITLDAGAALFDFDTIGNEGEISFRTNALNGSTNGINGVITSISLNFDPDIGTDSQNIAAATWTQLGTQHVYTSTSGTTSVGTTLTYDLSGLGLSNSSSFIAIRIDTARTATWNDSYIDDLTVLAVVPEPSTYAAMLGLLALGLVAWLRRRC